MGLILSWIGFFKHRIGRLTVDLVQHDTHRIIERAIGLTALAQASIDGLRIFRRTEQVEFIWFGSVEMAMTMAIAIAAAAPSPVATFSFLSRSRPSTRWAVTRLSSISTQSSSPLKKELILYSKPGCCLCDGLKEKLNAAFSLGGPDSLADVQLQVRDISTNAEWEKRYQYEIPVLARLLSDGTEEILPRLSPRLGVELIQKKIAAALRQ